MIFDKKKRLKKSAIVLKINKDIFYVYYYCYLKKI